MYKAFVCESLHVHTTLVLPPVVMADMNATNCTVMPAPINCTTPINYRAYELYTTLINLIFSTTLLTSNKYNESTSNFNPRSQCAID